ncbi:MAG: hypothetical protein VSS75_022645 [Candidatus Parabeggiatoa sp.]|nr:hypothetical protein [Candidatus Parabeggiatoa sp.]
MKEEKEEILGTWKLIGMKNYFADGTILDTLNSPFQGIRIYTANNITAVLIEGSLSDRVLDISPIKAPDEIRKRPFRAYWSRYEIDEEAQLVRHYFLGGSKQSSEPIEERGLKLTGDSLILTKKDKDFLQKGCYVESIYERWYD